MLKYLLLGPIQGKLREIKFHVVPGVETGDLNIQKQENLYF